MPSEVWNSSLIFHQLSQTCSQTFPTRVHTLVPDSKELHRSHKCGSVRRTSAGGSGGWGKIVFCLFGLGSPSPQSLSLPFLPCEDAWDLQMSKQGISSKGGRHLPSRASGVPRALRGVQREDSFPHSWLFPKEGGKGDKRGEKRSGDSLCICVQYGLF